MLPIRPVPVNNSRARRDRIQRHGTPSAGTACDPAEAAGSGRADKAPSPAARAAFSASCFENSCGHPPPGWVGSSNKPLLCKTGQSRSFLPEPGAPRRRAGPRAERRPRPRRRGGSGTSLPPSRRAGAQRRLPGALRRRRPARGGSGDPPWGGRGAGGCCRSASCSCWAAPPPVRAPARTRGSATPSRAPAASRCAGPGGFRPGPAALGGRGGRPGRGAALPAGGEGRCRGGPRG